MTAAPHRGAAFLQQDWRRAGRVERQEFVPALPWPLLDQLGIEAVFPGRDADEPGMRAERVMEQDQHWVADRAGAADRATGESHRDASV